MFGLCSSNKQKEHGTCGSSKPAPCGKKPEKKQSGGCGQKEHKGKSCKPGKITRNAFFNFLRELRVKHCDWPVTKIAVEGAKCWCKMDQEAKKKYIDMARSAPKMHRRSKHHRRGSGSRRRGSCGSKRRESRRRGSCGSKGRSHGRSRHRRSHQRRSGCR